MKLWVDDIRPAPMGYYWCKTVDFVINLLNDSNIHIKELNLDHDAGEMFEYGGDYIEILNYMEMCHYEYNKDFSFIIKIHSSNPVGRKNMERIISNNGWILT